MSGRWLQNMEETDARPLVLGQAEAVLGSLGVEEGDNTLDLRYRGESAWIADWTFDDVRAEDVGEFVWQVFAGGARVTPQRTFLVQ